MSLNDRRIPRAVTSQLRVKAGANVIWGVVCPLWIFFGYSKVPMLQDWMVPMYIFTIKLWISIPTVIFFQTDFRKLKKNQESVVLMKGETSKSRSG